MKVIHRVQHTSFRVAGKSGQGFLWRNGNSLGASADHKRFLPKGATQDEFNPSYWSIRNPTPLQIGVFLSTLSAG